MTRAGHWVQSTKTPMGPFPAALDADSGKLGPPPIRVSGLSRSPHSPARFAVVPPRSARTRPDSGPSVLGYPLPASATEGRGPFRAIDEDKKGRDSPPTARTSGATKRSSNERLSCPSPSNRLLPDVLSRDAILEPTKNTTSWAVGANLFFFFFLERQVDNPIRAPPKKHRPFHVRYCAAHP